MGHGGFRLPAFPRLFIPTALLVAAITLGAATRAGAVSEAAAPCLSIPPGARASALGESFGAVSDDPTSIYWNPAGLAWQEGVRIMHLRNQLVPALSPEIFYQFRAATFGYRHFGVGVSRTFLDYGSWEVTSPEGQSLGTYRSWERSYGLSVAWSPDPHVAIGTTAKTVKLSLVPASLQGLEEGVGDSWAVDFGLLLRSPLDIARVGVGGQNFGPDVRFADASQRAPLPRHARLSLAVRPLRALGPRCNPPMDRLLGT